jgi:hypothetical protein
VLDDTAIIEEYSPEGQDPSGSDAMAPAPAVPNDSVVRANYTLDLRVASAAEDPFLGEERRPR